MCVCGGGGGGGGDTGIRGRMILLHRQGVFRQAWFTLTSFTSDFGLSLVDYFPLIPKAHKIAVVLV